MNAAAGHPAQGRRYRVLGRVQRVGFRHYTRVQAEALGVVGTAENLADGSVEIYAGGDSAVLDDFEARVRRGPRASRVDDLEAHRLDGPELRDHAHRWQGFRVIR